MRTDQRHLRFHVRCENHIDHRCMKRSYCREGSRVPGAFSDPGRMLENAAQHFYEVRAVGSGKRVQIFGRFGIHKVSVVAAYG